MQENKNLRKPKQGRLWGRALMIKPDKEKKLKEKSGIPIGRISASAVRDYLNCQKLFYYRYILRMKLPTKPIQLVYGGAFHLGIEAYYEGKDPTKVFKANFKREEVDITPEQLEKNPNIFEENLADGIYLMEAWKEQADDIHKQYGISKGGQSEVKFESWWKNPSNGERLPAIVSGRFDRLTDDECIIEFKTAKKPYKQETVDTTIQADTYCFEYYTLKKKPPKKMFYIVFIKGRKKNPIQVLTTTRSKENYSQIFDTIKLILNNLKGRTEKDYAYGEGFMHNYCDCRKFEEVLLL